jgi:hypothetical protein
MPLEDPAGMPVRLMTDELPDGGSLYELPGRKAIGIDVKSATCAYEKGWAVAFVSSRTRLYLSA